MLATSGEPQAGATSGGAGVGGRTGQFPVTENWLDAKPKSRAKSTEPLSCILSIANVLIDLGSGDGRVVVSAAERGAQAVGIDISEQRVAEGRQRAERSGDLVSRRCRFECKDFLQADFEIPRDATIVYLFVGPGVLNP